MILKVDNVIPENEGVTVTLNGIPYISKDYGYEVGQYYIVQILNNAVIYAIKTNNIISNLEWCTASENSNHALNMGLSYQKPGEGHHMSKLTEKEVIVIRELYKNNTTQKEISFLFNVSQTQIYRIVNKKSWSHI